MGTCLFAKALPSNGYVYLLIKNLIGEHVGRVWNNAAVASVSVQELEETRKPQSGYPMCRYTDLFDFWDVTPYSLAERYQRLDGTCSLQNMGHTLIRIIPNLSAFSPFSRFVDDRMMLSASDDRMIAEAVVASSKYCPGICPEGENPSQASQCPVRYSNPEPPECEYRVIFDQMSQLFRASTRKPGHKTSETDIQQYFATCGS
jgi:hypothetical protein